MDSVIKKLKRHRQERIMIDGERLARTFRDLVEIDSVSREEKALCGEIRSRLQSVGAETVVDDTGEKVGGDSGNLIARFPGTVSVSPLFLCAHMDTVEPGRRVKALFTDGVFTGDGTTILGADDKSAIAVLLEVLSVIRENRLACCPLEMVFTVCEEVGLLGARHLDMKAISAPFGYVLDATDTEGIVTRAPSANKLEFIVHGKASHAGSAPEKGINAIRIAAQAIASVECGRIDRETTCNIGVFQGGRATNIVADRANVRAEVRSHSMEKLNRVTEGIVSCFRRAVEEHPFRSEGGLPRLEHRVERSYEKTFIPDDHPAVALAVRAAQNLGRKMITKATGGGSDANVFFFRGLVAGVLGTGMQEVHTLEESVCLEDMVRSAELLLEIIRLHTMGKNAL